MPVAQLHNSTDCTYSRQEFAPLNLLSHPVWVFDIERSAMWWANDAALALWEADSLEALLQRDFKSDMSDVTRARLQNYLRRFAAGESIIEQWTFYPQGQVTTVDCTCQGMNLEDGRLAMLVEGRARKITRIEQDSLRGVEALRYTPVMISLFDLQGRLLFSNPSADQTFDAPGRLNADFHARFALDTEARHCWDQAISGKPIEGEHQFHTLTGVRWHQYQCRLTEDPVSGAPAVLLNQLDVTERKIIGAMLDKLSRAVEHTGSIVIITDHNGCIEYVNPHFSTLTGYGFDEVIGRTPDMLHTGAHTGTDYSSLWQTISKGHTWNGELRSRKKDGGLYWNLLTISPIRDEEGQITHFVWVGEDVSALKEAHAKAEQLSLFDSLTGLANRRLFGDRLSQAVKSAKRMDSPTALLYLDLDRFKDINDSLGHETGDRVLVEVARRLRECIREEDTVARLGGDEFSILLPGVEDANATRKVARKILNSLSQPLDIPGLHAPLTTSVGITLLPTDSLNPEILMRNADLAMYSAKAKGRNTYQFFTDAMNREVSERLEIERELRRSLEADQLQLHYQPIVRLEDLRIVGAEALVRWNHPRLGAVPAQRFISIAEESDLILLLGEWVLATTCREVCDQKANGLSLDWVCVNVSARQFLQPNFCDSVKADLRDLGRNAPELKLELTESALMEQTEAAIATLEKLQNLGVRLSIDDFGTGYSSLSYLKRFPVETLKIDRSFVRDIPQDPSDMEIVAAIIAMARKLGVKTIAEGIETEAQLDFLRTNQCVYGQGYLFGKPMPIEELRTLIGTQETQVRSTAGVI